MDPIKLVNSRTTTRIAIQDFMHRVARNQFSNHERCALCQGKMNSIHLINECGTVKNWEREIGCSKQAKIRRKYQFKKTSKGSILHRNAMWIVNWSIWITYNYIKHNETKKETHSKIFKKNIENEEFRYLNLHLKNNNAFDIKQRNKDCLIKHLRFKTFKNNLIISK